MIEAHAWNDRLDLANDDMDREHHLQIALVSAFVDAAQNGRPWMERRLLDQLAGYSTAHFGSEELLMEASAYPERAAHAAEHAALLERIAELNRGFADGDEGAILAAALDLRTALAAHIAGSDRRLAAHLGNDSRN